MRKALATGLRRMFLNSPATTGYGQWNSGQSGSATHVAVGSGLPAAALPKQSTVQRSMMPEATSATRGKK